MDTPNIANVARYLRIAAFLWLAYLFAFAGIGFLTASNYVPWFSVTQAILILPILTLAFWERTSRRLERDFVLPVLVCMSLLPIVLNHLVLFWGPPAPFSLAEGVTLRLMPLLFLALGLIAWRLQWRHVLGFCIFVAILDIGMVLVNNAIAFREPPPGIPPPPPLTPFLAQFGITATFLAALMAALVQFFALLIVGTFIALLMLRLRAEHAALERANTNLADYASTLEHLAISRERNRVARELHDTLAHTLTGMTVQLETMKAYWDVDHTAARTLLDQILDTSRQGAQETRRALKELRASPLDDLGLALAIRQLAESAAERAHLGLHMAIAETVPNLTPEVEQGIYRIAQEAIENVAHHAHAQHLHVALAQPNSHVVLDIRDDGKGFDLNQAAATGHYGLAGMKERAAIIGGQLDISSESGKGTRILLTV